jgi:hypothetical protein
MAKFPWNLLFAKMTKIINLPTECLMLIAEYDPPSIPSLLLTCVAFHDRLCNYNWITDAIVTDLEAKKRTRFSVRRFFFEEIRMCNPIVLKRLAHRGVITLWDESFIRELTGHGLMKQALWANFKARQAQGFISNDHIVLVAVLDRCDTIQTARYYLSWITKFANLSQQSVIRALIHRGISHEVVAYIFQTLELRIDFDRLHVYFTREPPGHDMIMLLDRLMPHHGRDEIAVQLLDIYPARCNLIRDSNFVRQIIKEAPQVLSNKDLFHRLLRRLEQSYDQATQLERTSLFVSCFRSRQLPKELPLKMRGRLAELFRRVPGADQTTDKWLE